LIHSFDLRFKEGELFSSRGRRRFFTECVIGHVIAKGQVDQAVATSEKAVAVSGRAPAALGVLGLAYGVAGRKREANKVLNELLQLQKQRYVTPMAFTYVYIGLGNKDQAFAWLEKAYQERSNHIAFFKVTPTVDPLRSDPRFADLLRQTGWIDSLSVNCDPTQRFPTEG
jgi:tetratricopeptide (TPR) repeat protein